ncbi:MAG: bifunctional folylpolyglutamate synthase/dihydrofolate synthase [Candidatus Omnitrophica bacterium]|nr:bifunctional folylpolyglutamate synthase/dihydrofolate synthase [Candidatus Omnitrophota bacterium]
MTYPQAIQYLESFINYERLVDWPYKQSFQLDGFKAFLETIGNPQDSLHCIHIAGSKGKGSTCAFIAYILREAGFKVGLYTSPHLYDFRERIRVLTRDSVCSDFSGMVAKKRLASLVQRVRPAIEKHNKISKYGPLSFFEVYTALAFIYFKEEKVDFAVLETGLGGRLDATNTQEALVSVITPISYEHTHLLGNTLREIARQKAGIIKNRESIVITAPQEKQVLAVIRDRCKKVGAQIFEVGKDIKILRPQNFRIRLVGRHQLINATVAKGAVEALGNFGFNVEAGLIRKGLYNTVWPGRCEVVSRQPLIVLDGAQNAASSSVLKKAITQNFKYNKLILVLGVSQDKDIAGICNELYSLAGEIILTRSNNPRAASVENIQKLVDSPVTKTKDVKQALSLAKLKAGPKDLILVTGSLFVVGEARKLICVN